MAKKKATTYYVGVRFIPPEVPGNARLYSYKCKSKDFVPGDKVIVEARGKESVAWIGTFPTEQANEKATAFVLRKVVEDEQSEG